MLGAEAGICARYEVQHIFILTLKEALQARENFTVYVNTQPDLKQWKHDYFWKL